MAVGAFDRRNPLHLTHNLAGEELEEELRALRAYLYANWTGLETLRSAFQRDMVREMMARVRYYEALGYQFEPENIRETDPPTT